MVRTDHATLLARLRRALDYCESIEVDARAGRYGEYERWVEILVEDVRAGETSERWDQAEILNAIHESIEFSEQCVPYLSTQDPTLARAKLTRIVLGSRRANAESSRDGSNEARNHVFETLLAAQMAGGGLVPRIQEPDLTVPAADRTLLVACKRPFRLSGVNQGAKRAREQIERRRRERRDDCVGVVAISSTRVGLSGVRRVGQAGWDAPVTELDATDRAADALQQMYERRIRKQVAKDKRIAGTIVHHSELIHEAETGLYCVGQTSLVVTFGDSPPSRSRSDEGTRTSFGRVQVA